jgi:hypothetical protein
MARAMSFSVSVEDVVIWYLGVVSFSVTIDI